MVTTLLGGIPLDEITPSSMRVVEDIRGWFGSGSNRSGMQERAQQDGDWDGTGHRPRRTVVIKGACEAATAAEAHAFARSLTALSPQARYELVVDSPAEGVLSTIVRVISPPDPEWLGSGRAFEYTLTVAAPDPLLYGPPMYDTANLASSTPGAGLTYPLAYPLDYGIAPGVTPGALFLPNSGTSAYWPRLRIDGPVLNPQVTCVETGAWVRFGGQVPAGQYLDIDTGLRRVLLAGQVSLRHLVTSGGNWLATPVGGASYTWTADTANPAALLSAWGYEGAYS